jgi:phospholipid-binding lipoprotein MlaA
VPSGPYLMLPILGPSTVRDTAALPVDYMGGLISNVDNIPIRNVLYGMRLVDARAQLLNVDKMLDQMALDRYSFTRDVFLQRRLNDVYDGNPPDNP